MKLQALLLFSIATILSPQNVHSQLTAGKPGINLPSDGKTLQDGIAEYPPRKDQLPTASFSTQEIEKEGCPYTVDDANRLLSTIENVVLKFYSENYQKINLRSDLAVFGLSSLSHQLLRILEENRYEISPSIRNFLVDVKIAAMDLERKILDQPKQAITDSSQKYGAEVLRNFSLSVYGAPKGKPATLWKSFEAIKKHFGEFTKIGQEKEVVYPYLDYHCMIALVESCSVPHVCQKLFLEEPYSQFKLVHQVFYQQLARARGCVESNKVGFGDVEEYRNRLCSKAYLEAQFIEKNNFPTKFIDLFAEQVGFCGMFGYRNFMRADWLREILSWSSGSGCVPNVYGEKKTTDEVVFATTKNGEQESCLVHLTSASLAALSSNLRYLFDSCTSDIYQNFKRSTTSLGVY